MYLLGAAVARVLGSWWTFEKEVGRKDHWLGIDSNIGGSVDFLPNRGRNAELIPSVVPLAVVPSVQETVGTMLGVNKRQSGLSQRTQEGQSEGFLQEISQVKMTEFPKDMEMC